jgi:peptidoglycan/LPS O-acetylase OafA/YrhL
MEHTYLFFLIPVFVTLYISIKLINKIIPLTVVNVKYPEIDGLRGYLAFFVFLHHSYIWRIFLKTKEWEEPKSNLFNQFGQTSVVFFFIITAFLFISKFLDKKSSPFDWKKFIIARFFRMFPMYFFSICLVFFIVAIESDFLLKESFLNIAKATISWLFFCTNGAVDINTIEKTFQINAGIAWSLPYEWMFYFLLPIFAIIFKIRVNYKILLTYTLMFLITLYINESSLKKFIPFLGGILCAVLLKSKEKANLKQTKYTFLAMLLIFLSLFFFNKGRDIIPTIITTFIFLTIASGNSFFGILSNSFSRKFGQVTYSLYLLHGIILFIIFRFILGFEKANALTNIEYWSVISSSLFVIILVSQLTYKYIELPMMNFHKHKN